MSTTVLNGFQEVIRESKKYYQINFSSQLALRTKTNE
jgi:hypothetical protein